MSEKNINFAMYYGVVCPVANKKKKEVRNLTV